jgi:hypothetical protein
VVQKYFIFWEVATVYPKNAWTRHISGKKSLILHSEIINWN